MCTLINSPNAIKCSACDNRRDDINEGDLKFSYDELLELEKCPAVLNKEVFECKICYTDCEPGEGIILRECLHYFCRNCLSSLIEGCEEIEVKCPYIDDNYVCPSTLQEREIKFIAKPEIYERHLKIRLAITENKTENAFHCKTPDCPGQCIIENEGVPGVINVFVCNVCQSNNCISCQAIHPQVNCKQYQIELEIQSTTDPKARKTIEYIKKMKDSKKAMNCPKCNVIVMKSEGCDYIQCTMCKTDICWATMGPRWGPRGFGDTSGGCRCKVNGVICHPNCRNCH